MARVRTNFWTGTLSSQILAGATTLMSAELSSFPEVAGSDVAYLVIDPSGSTPEIVKVTAHTVGATTATVVRGQDSTTDRTWAAGTAVMQGTVASDWDSYLALDADVFVPAGSGASASGSPALSTSQVPCWLMDASSIEQVAFSANIPAGWSTFSITTVWHNPTASSGNIRTRMFYKGVANAAAFSSATSSSYYTVAAGGQYVQFRQAMATGVANVADSVWTFVVERTANHGDDTLANDVGLVGLILSMDT